MKTKYILRAFVGSLLLSTANAADDTTPALNPPEEAQLVVAPVVTFPGLSTLRNHPQVSRRLYDVLKTLAPTDVGIRTRTIQTVNEAVFNSMRGQLVNNLSNIGFVETIAEGATNRVNNLFVNIVINQLQNLTLNAVGTLHPLIAAGVRAYGIANRLGVVPGQTRNTADNEVIGYAMRAITETVGFIVRPPVGKINRALLREQLDNIDRFLMLALTNSNSNFSIGGMIVNYSNTLAQQMLQNRLVTEDYAIENENGNMQLGYILNNRQGADYNRIRYAREVDANNAFLAHGGDIVRAFTGTDGDIQELFSTLAREANASMEGLLNHYVSIYAEFAEDFATDTTRVDRILTRSAFVASLYEGSRPENIQYILSEHAPHSMATGISLTNRVRALSSAVQNTATGAAVGGTLFSLYSLGSLFYREACNFWNPLSIKGEIMPLAEDHIDRSMMSPEMVLAATGALSMATGHQGYVWAQNHGYNPNKVGCAAASTAAAVTIALTTPVGAAIVGSSALQSVLAVASLGYAFTYVNHKAQNLHAGMGGMASSIKNWFKY